VETITRRSRSPNPTDSQLGALPGIYLNILYALLKKNNNNNDNTNNKDVVSITYNIILQASAAVVADAMKAK